MPIVSAFENKWFSSHLLAAKEPSLFQASRNSRASYDAIRFTWLRSFDPPVIVRIEGINSASARLIAKQLSGAGGYDPGTISKHTERQLTREEIRRMRELLMRTRLTSLPAKDCALGTDGSEWLIEVADRSGYHFINRWSPERGEVREFGIAVLKLTGWQFKKVY